jgi:hypothetical protein
MLKSLYGTPDAPRIWYRTFADFLLSIGFQKCEREPCLFQHTTTGVLLMLYVDDLAVAGPTQQLVAQVVSRLKQKFQMREMGAPSE